MTYSLRETKPRRYSIPWTTVANGTYSEAIPGVCGQLARVVFVPGTGGSQPTNGHAITLSDEDGLDVLSGQGASLSNAAASNVVPGVPLKDGTTTSTTPQTVSGRLTLAVSGAGNGKSGTVVLYVQP